MDLSILLVFEVVGLLALASVMTGVLIWGDLTRGRASERSVRLPVMVFCPRSMESVKVRLGALVREDRTEFSVLECDAFGDGPVLCGEDCLEPAVVT